MAREWHDSDHPRDQAGRFRDAGPGPASDWTTPQRVRLRGSRHIYVTGQFDSYGRVHIQPEGNIPPHQNRGGWHHESWLERVDAPEPGPDWAGRLLSRHFGEARPEPTPEQTAQREAVLEALNPEAAFRSKYAALLTELRPTISQAEIDDAAQDHLKYARAGLQAPITDEDLDWGLASYISLLDGDSIVNVYDALMELQQRTGRSFPNTIDAIDEMGLLDQEDY